MKKTKLHIFLCAACMMLGLSACMDEHDQPDTDGYLITSPIALGDTNYSIARLKADNDSLFSQINAFQQVEEDLILEGVVVANDEGGNLYQTLLVRDIDEQAGTDEAIVLAVKNTCLYPYFMLGQRIKVNLRGLYIGCYSKLPKIGQPYYTSSGNLRLGPILLQLCRTNVELIGEPDRDCPEMQPVELTASQLAEWEADFSKHIPQLVTIEGTLDEADSTAIFAPEELQDAGYGVDRTLTLAGSREKVTLRTSTQNDVAFTVMPTGVCRFTGLLSYYDQWQIQLRSTADIHIPESGEPAAPATH